MFKKMIYALLWICILSSPVYTADAPASLDTGTSAVVIADR